MTYLLKDLDILKAKIKANRILLFLDYDGTLTPIVERPELAVLSKETKDTLSNLANNDLFQIIIVSGRSMADVKKLVGIDRIAYIGNHGLENEHGDFDFGDFPFSNFRDILEHLKLEISKVLVSFQGVFIEDKGLNLSIHYRLLSLKEEPAFKDFFEGITKDLLSKKEIRIVHGKKVFEIRPPIEWDKGKAVLWMLRPHQDALKNKNTVAIYIGDDQTDEDAFLAIKDQGITVYVGNQNQASSCAQYYLNNTQEVIKFLKYLSEEYCNEKI